MFKTARLFIYFSLFLFAFLFSSASVFAATTTLKPQISWQRSTEAQDKVVTETSVGSKVNEALQLPLDANQVVFDNGVSTPQVNKNAVDSNVSWASWIQYSSLGNACGPVFELRHFQAKFNLLSGFDQSKVEKVRLKSPYYQDDTFPINDNAYIYLNGNFVKRLGTSYGASNIGMNGRAPYANETDGWIANGNLGSTPATFLHPGQNTLDIVAGEWCLWGGMGKLELIIELKAPTPFLDLPWDYQGKGLSFTEAALAINSYFDHEYPLLSSGLSEPSGTGSDIVNFRGSEKKRLPYSSHDGYDYGKDAKALIGDPVLAAADGCASYFKTGAGGNTIRVDHSNSYQTRYLHLLDDEFLITKSSSCLSVIAGQRIGTVGYSGTTDPKGPQGAHIHFMVIQDKNNDGNFDDNIPDGVTDPFGWQSQEADPWPNFAFNYAGQSRTGNVSFYLWTKAIANLSNQLTSNGGFFELERYKLNFPQGSTNQNLNIQMESAPVAKPTNVLESIGSTLVVTAKDALGSIVHTFQNLFTITIDFAPFDLSEYDTDTIAIYSSEDGVNWTKESTVIDLNTKTASAQLNHLSYFALMAERLDTLAPTTNAVLSGEQGQPDWFRSDVQLALNAQDNEEGLGVDYTLYKVNEGDWQQYTAPLTFTDEGSYQIEFYSVDNDENVEQFKSVTFHIDKSLPEAKIFINPDVSDLVVEGIDTNPTTVEKAENSDTKKKDDAIYKISDLAGNVLSLDVRDRDKEKRDRFKIYSLQYNQLGPIELPDNHYNVSYQGNKDKLNVKEQNFEIEGEVKIRIKYDRKKDQSTIITKEAGMEKVKEIKSGLILLLLNTTNGNLEYGY